MAATINGQTLVPADLTNAALLADMQYYEPYSSQGLNRKLRNIIQPGIYNGFEVSPGTQGLQVVISSTAAGGGAISFNIEDRYQISLQQLRDVTLTLRAGQTWKIVAQVNYQFGTITTQVSQTSNQQAAIITAISASQALAANQMELARVTIPATASRITNLMIDRSQRIHRQVGLLITDETNLQSSTVVASAWAVKKAFEAATAAAGSKLSMNNTLGIGTETIPLLTSMDWQQHQFHGDEYVYIQWEQTTNRPEIDYPNGYYQISVLGLSDTDHQSLLIRPVNYLEPLAPFMISWTGDKGSRVFRWRAVLTALGNINDLGNIGPNDLKKKCHVGQFSQPEDRLALKNKGYPILEAGCLFVEPSIAATEYVAQKRVNSGVQQRYITYSSNRMYIRGMTASGSFSAWKEVPNLSNDLLMTGGKVLGIEALDQNRVYMVNSRSELGNLDRNEIVAATRYRWYSQDVLAGIRRDTSTGTLGFSVEITDKERFRVSPFGEVVAYGTGFSACGTNPQVSFYNDPGTTELARIQVSSSALNLAYLSDGSQISLKNHGLLSVGTPIGWAGAILAGSVEGSAAQYWQTRSTGLRVDITQSTNWFNVWKAVSGSNSVAALQVAYTNGSPGVQIEVGAESFVFGSAGGFLASELITEQLNINDYRGQTRGSITADSTGMEFAVGDVVNKKTIKFESSGQLTSTGNASFRDVYISSDRTLKRKLRRFENVLDGLKLVQGYLYEIRSGDDDENWSQSGGVIAQDVQKAFPELVTTGSDGKLKLNYNGLIGVLVEAVNILAEGR